MDTRDLGRRAGEMRRLRRTVPAPADLGIDVIGVPDGSDVELDLRLESVVEGVLVSGTARARLAGECVRCLDPVTSELEVPIQELFHYPDRRSLPGSDHGSGAGDEDGTARLEGDLLDLEPVLRDAVVLALPFQPVCRDDCPGLCSVCGGRLADDPGHGHEQDDPRWAALRGLARPDQNDPDQEEES